MSRPYRLFQVVGLEIEYAAVDADLRPVPAVEDALAAIHGRPTSETEQRHVGYSNELAAHVFEIKTLHPVTTLDVAERRLHEGVRRIAGVLRDSGARLLPTGMHPFMRPADALLWRRAGRRIYRSYDRVFDTRGHGWLNVQATHVNLPFGTEAETVRLHNAIACLLPYLPVLAASSPVYGGRLRRALDNRLRFYRTNQRRIPAITGDVVPEFVQSFQEYRLRVLQPIYRALDRIVGGDVLRHEWVNSRGAILRFMRRAIEIRVLDTQECVKADAAIAAFARGALRWMVVELAERRIGLPEHRALVRDFARIVRDGRRARVDAPHLWPGGTAGEVVELLRDRATDFLPLAERPYLAIIDDRLQNGNLAERIGAAIRRGRPIRAIYEELTECLLRNVVWTR